MPFDRIRETSTTTGTGALTLGGAPVGFRAFSSVYTPGAGVVISYVIEGITALGVQTGEWEVGTGTLAGDGTFTRSAVIASSNAGALVAFSPGTKRVFDSATVGAVDARAAAAVATHAAAADPHGDRAFASNIATTTPAAGAVPKAGADGLLGDGWLPPTDIARIDFGAAARGLPGWIYLNGTGVPPVAVAGVSRLAPFFCDAPITLTSILFHVAIAGGVLADVSVWSATPQAATPGVAPTTRVSNVTGIDVSVVGAIDVAVSVPLTRGWYVIVITVSASTTLGGYPLHAGGLRSSGALVPGNARCIQTIAANTGYPAPSTWAASITVTTASGANGFRSPALLGWT